MDKRLIGISILFLLALSLVSAQTTLVYNETDRVSLQVFATDPDAEDRERLTTGYSGPLSRQGEWQTTYGDAGVYEVQVEVSDGELASVENVTIVVQRKEEEPELVRSLPDRKNITLDEGRSLTFTVSAQDRNQDLLTYQWSLDGRPVGEGQSIRFSPQYGGAGQYILEVAISDGISTITQGWRITVNEVDLQQQVMDSIGNLIIEEGEVARLPLPDYRYYGLDVTLSEPLGKSNQWMTGYDSAGVYPINVTVQGKGFHERKRIFLVVENVDRPPVFSPRAPLTVAEGQRLSFSPQVTDPDNDTIIYSLRDLPPGATYEDNLLSWTPGFDAVQNTNLLSDVARRFHLLSNTYSFTMVAQSRNLTVEQEVPIVVFNTNRPPSLEQLQDIAVREGEILDLSPEASDPDGDPISFSYRGWISAGERIGYDQAGTHYLTITASDGFLEDSQAIRVEVENTNRPPQIEPVKRQRIQENRTLSVLLSASDPDNDGVRFSLVDPPEGAYLEDSTLFWTPPFTAVQGATERSVPLTVRASDGTDSTDLEVPVTVEQVNMPPAISEASPQRDSARLGQPYVFWARAADMDGDNLTYTWRFGLFDSHQGQAHQRTFTSPGEKSVRLTVDDGSEPVTKEFLIDVAES